MYEVDKQLFVGIKISSKLQSELDHCASEKERYFKEGKLEYLQIVTLGNEKLIGRFLKDGFPVSDMDNVTRNVRSIVQLVAPRYLVEDNSIQIYAGCTVRPLA